MKLVLSAALVVALRMSFHIDNDHWAEKISKPVSWQSVELKQLTLSRRQWLSLEEAADSRGDSVLSIVTDGMEWCRLKGVDFETHFGPWAEVFARHCVAFNSGMERVEAQYRQRIKDTPDACEEERALQWKLVVAETEVLRERHVYRGIWLADLDMSA